MAGDLENQELLREGELGPGTRLGRYRIEGIVGRGGMGTVYRAFDDETRREVAIKVLLPDLPESLRERFLAESEAEARIRHPHVMPVYDRGRFGDGRLYFVMELLYEPITLAEVVETAQKGKLGQTWPRLRHWASPQRLAADVLAPIADGVEVANREYGILHRDLKPDNVLVDVRTRRPYLIDFGICHREGQDLEQGKVVGTPRFLAPEQARGALDPRTDVWGLGTLLRFLFTGAPPIRPSSPLGRDERDRKIAELRAAEEKARSTGNGARANELAARRRGLEAPTFRAVEDMFEDARSARYAPLPETVPAPARAIIEKAMAKEPGERYPSAAAFADDVRAWTAGERVEAQEERDAKGAAVAAARRRVRPYVVPAALAALGLLLGLAIGIGFLSGPAEHTLERIALAEEEVERVEAELLALETAAPMPAELDLRHGWLRTRLAAARALWDGLPEGATKSSCLRTLTEVEARLAPPPLRLAGAEGRRWKALRVWDGRLFDVEPGDNALPPGLYVLGLAGKSWLRVPFTVPWGRDAPRDPVVLSIDVPIRAPEGMIYVPASATAAPFWIGEHEVTYREYVEWIDELPVGERKGRLPLRGFVASETAPGQVLVEPGYDDRPVTGIRPIDAAAYAAWRAALHDRAIRLPTGQEWRRAAGSELLRREAWRLFAPPGLDAEGRPTHDRSPYGVDNLLGVPPELIATPDGFAVAGRGGPGGIELTPAALARLDPTAADARSNAAFRLAAPID